MAAAVPKSISPLIRAGRWSLLLTGLVYGRVHYNTLKTREEQIRPNEIDRVTQHAIDQLAEKKIKADQSMVDLAHAAGIDPNKARMKQIEAEVQNLNQTNKQSSSTSKHH
jgi:response regulator of citrate/malate metabolism